MENALNEPFGPENEPNPVVKAVEIKPKSTNACTGKGCVECCNRSRAETKLAVFQLLGDLITSLGEQINFIDSHRNFAGFSEQGLIAYGFLDAPKGPIVDFKQFEANKVRVKFLTDADYQRNRDNVGGFLSAAITGVIALNTIQAFQNTLGIVEAFQTALQLIPDKAPPGIADPCEECCRKRLFRQDKDRITVVDKHRKRIP